MALLGSYGNASASTACAACATGTSRHVVLFGADVVAGQGNCSVDDVYSHCAYSPEAQCERARPPSPPCRRASRAHAHPPAACGPPGNRPISLVTRSSKHGVLCASY